jgi:transposase-like protein
MGFEPAARLVLETEISEVCPESGGKGFPGVVSRRDAGCRRGWGAEEKAEVSNGVSNGGFEPRTRDTLGGARKEIPIPDMLRRWVRELEMEGEDAFRGSGVLRTDEDELRRVKRELARVKEERDILIKAQA